MSSVSVSVTNSSSRFLRVLVPVAALFLFMSPAAAEGQTRDRIAILDFQMPCGIREWEGEQISEIVRTEIIISEVFHVLEKAQVDKIFREAGFQLTGLVDEGTIVEIGRLLDAEFLLVGSLARLDDFISISTRLVSTASGENIFSMELFTTEENFFDDIIEYSKGIANRATELSLGVTLENIEKFIEMRDYENAFFKLQLYRERHPDDTRAFELFEEVTRLQAEEKFTLARMAYSQGYFDLARNYAEQMIRLAPDISKYESYLQKIEETAGKADSRKYSLMIREVKKLIRQGRLIQAREILQEYIDKTGLAGKNGEILELLETIRYKTAERNYKTAAAYLSEDEFDEAETSIQSAIALNPEEEKYVALLNRVYKKEERRLDRAYEKMNTPPFLTFGTRYPYSVRTTFNVQFFSDPYYELAVQGGFPGAEADFMLFSRFLDPVQLVFNGGAAFYTGRSEEELPSGYMYSNFWYPALSGGVGLAAVLAYFDFGATVNLHAGIMGKETEQQLHTGYSAFTGAEFIFGPAVKVFASLYVWEGLYVTLTYKGSWLFRFGERTTGSHTLGLGGGYNF